MNIGIVVEDERDAVAYSELIRKIREDINEIRAVPCGGVGTLMKKFVGFLKYFEWRAPHSVDKALVIRDSECSDASVWETQLTLIYEQSHFAPSFPVLFHATKCEIETWLLADENAINEVARRRSKNKQIGPARIEFESYKPAKELFQKRLSDVGLPFDSQVYKEVASQADIARISAACRNFQRFVDKVQAP